MNIVNRINNNLFISLRPFSQAYWHACSARGLIDSISDGLNKVGRFVICIQTGKAIELTIEDQNRMHRARRVNESGGTHLARELFNSLDYKMTEIDELSIKAIFDTLPTAGYKGSREYSKYRNIRKVWSDIDAKLLPKESTNASI